MIRTRPAARAGFTLVEVMIAIGIMTIGSLGILSMHQAVSGANRAANEMNTALAITDRWIERIDRDSILWSEEGINSGALNSTAYLKELAGSIEPTGWFNPGTTDPEGFAFDYFGDDDPDFSDFKYCVNLSMSWLRQGSSARVDIRTFWFREGYVHGGHKHPDWVDGSDFRTSDCDAGTADGWNLGTAPNVNVVFASTVVRWMRRD